MMGRTWRERSGSSYIVSRGERPDRAKLGKLLRHRGHTAVGIVQQRCLYHGESRAPCGICLTQALASGRRPHRIIAQYRECRVR